MPHRVGQRERCRGRQDGVRLSSPSRASFLRSIDILAAFHGDEAQWKKISPVIHEKKREACQTCVRQFSGTFLPLAARAQNLPRPRTPSAERGGERKFAAAAKVTEGRAGFRPFATKHALLAAACPVSAKLGQHYLFIPMLDHQCENVGAVIIKIVHSKTK